MTDLRRRTKTSAVTSLDQKYVPIPPGIRVSYGQSRSFDRTKILTGSFHSLDAFPNPQIRHPVHNQVRLPFCLRSLPRRRAKESVRVHRLHRTQPAQPRLRVSVRRSGMGVDRETTLPGEVDLFRAVTPPRLTRSSRLSNRKFDGGDQEKKPFVHRRVGRSPEARHGPSVPRSRWSQSHVRVFRFYTVMLGEQGSARRLQTEQALFSADVACRVFRANSTSSQTIGPRSKSWPR